MAAVFDWHELTGQKNYYLWFEKHATLTVTHLLYTNTSETEALLCYFGLIVFHTPVCILAC